MTIWNAIGFLRGRLTRRRLRQYLAHTRFLFQPMNPDKLTAIRKGLLEYALLKVISSDKVYVADMLKRLGDTEFATQEGTLYPLLSRLRRENLVDYEWRESEAGPPRKYYELTRKGIALLTELDSYWKQLTTTIGHLGK
jgi:PadR family transcriptional regulator, regulatory protein PadR